MDATDGDKVNTPGDGSSGSVPAGKAIEGGAPGWSAGADVTDWQLTVQARARRVRVELAGASTDAHSRELVSAAEAELDVVDQSLVGPSGFWASVASWWSGWYIERAWRALHEAEVYAAAADAALPARIPSLLERIRPKLAAQDGRVRAVAALVQRDSVTSGDRLVVADALRAVFDASDAAHAGARALRNKLVGAGFILLLLNVCLAIAGLSAPKVLPMCSLAPESLHPERICVNGTALPSASDVLMVQLLGALGAVLATVVLLTRRKPSLSPYVLTGYQALIKVTFGAALAVVGVFALGAGVASGIACLRTQSSVLVCAVLLGYGQQVGTRLLDTYAEKVMSSVRPVSSEK